MTDRIKTTPGVARSYNAWKKRIESGKPNEGDYNFTLWKKGSEVIYEPPLDGSKPAVFKNGEWEELPVDN